MFKSLQVKFVAMVMAVVTVILAAVFVSVGVITTQQASERLMADMDSAIDLASSAQSPARLTAAPPEMGGAPGERSATPVAVYRIEGGELRVASRTAATLGSDVLAEVSRDCIAAPEGEGSLSSQGLVFLKRDVMGVDYVAFANDSAAENVRSIVTISLVVGIAALLMFFVASIAFSRWALRPVRQAWDQQRRFVTNASHDLKTPLSIIKANTEVLLDEPEAPVAERVRWLGITKEASEDMEKLVGEMLALASLDELAEANDRNDSSEDAGLEEVDLSRLLERCALQFEARSFEGGFELSTSIQEGVIVSSNAEVLRQIVQVLLDNACKYVNSDGKVLVGLSVEGSGSAGSPSWRKGSAFLEVSNTGEVISAEDLPHLFDRFYRVDSARDTRSGHGLGLSLAKGLAESIGSDLSVSSEDGLTTFRLEVRLQAGG